MKKNVLFLILSGLVLGFWVPYLKADWLLSYLGPLLLILFISYRKKGFLPFFLSFVGGFLISLLPLLFPVAGDRVTGLVILSRENYVLLDNGLARYYVYLPKNAYEIGDLLSLEGHFEPLSFTHYEGRFDFGEYLGLRGVRGEYVAYGEEVLFSFPLRLSKAREGFLASFEGETAALLDSLLFGIKDYDSQIIQIGERLGALYFLSSSGFYYAAFIRLFEKLFSFRLEKQSKALTLLVATLYLPFAFGKVSIYRVYLIRLFWLLDKRKTGRAREYAASVLLAVDRFNALSSSFLMGFAISYFMALAGPLLRNTKSRRRIFGRLLLFLLLLPSFSDGGELHLLSFLFSFILVPAYFPFLFLGLLSFLTVPFVSVLNGYTSLLLSLMAFLSKIDAVVPFISLQGLQGLYFSVVYILFYLVEAGFQNIAKQVTLIFLLGMVVALVPIGNGLSSSISFIDVGQGDSTLIVKGYEAVLVDTGGNLSFDMAEEVLIPYFRKERISRLKALVITHDDYDHAGAKDSLLSSFKVERVLDEHRDFPFSFAGVTLTSLNPGGYGDSNEDSLVLSLTLGGDSYLLTGDAGERAEAAMLKSGVELKHDVLKVGHHGSDTSSSPAFLEAVAPRTAVISVGKGNRYGHPTDKVLRRLRKIGAEIRRTDEEGTIVFRYLFGRLPLPFVLVRGGFGAYNAPDDPRRLFAPAQDGGKGAREAPWPFEGERHFLRSPGRTSFGLSGRARGRPP